MLLQVTNVSHAFGTKRVLHQCNLDIEPGQFVAVVGASGCGKSTLLRAVLGTDPPTEGGVMVGGKEVTGPNRDVGIVYQQYILFPFYTALRNVAFGPFLDQTTFPERLFHPFRCWKLFKRHREEARNMLIDFDMESCLDSYPDKMSGGQRQRVSIAQTLIMKPKIALLDEPFGALDESTREDLQHLLLRLYQENLKAKAEGLPPPHTIMFVTHELNEAFYIADRVVGLSRFWTCPDSGERGADCGATIVYDQAAPIFGPDDPRDFSRFADQKADLRKIVFDQNDKINPAAGRTFKTGV
jgi:NitT/TauT family transport system ATP-binding protein